MLLIPKTNDQRYFYLKSYFKDDEVIYDYKDNDYSNITKIILPYNGLDSDGFIKGCSIDFISLLKRNTITLVYGFKKTKLLGELEQKFKFKFVSFYDDCEYLKMEFLLIEDIITFLLTDKFNQNISNINIKVLGNSKKSSQLRKKFTYKEDKKIDCIIHVDGLVNHVNNFKIWIEFLPYDIDDFIFKKNVFLVDFLLCHYLTKSGAKLLYDTMMREIC